MTVKFNLIGYPIKHSLSPWIHEQFIKKAGIDATYSLFEIGLNEDFSEKITELKNSGTKGFNVTIPYKQTIIPFLDELDHTAMQMQAVNTVVERNGKWYGYNTDGVGYLRSIKSAYPKKFTHLNKVLIIGAGGAARAIYYALVKEGISQIDIANRTLKNAEDIRTLGQGKTETAIYTIEEAEKKTADYDLIIQTTSVGMKPNEENLVMKLSHVNSDAIISDIVYQPIVTQLLKEGKRHGCDVHYGHTMLIYQGQASFEIWTQINVDTAGMASQLQAILEGR